MLLDIFADILELPINLTLTEAIKKLQGTYMALNGELVYVSSIDENSIIVKSRYGTGAYIEEDVESLEVWLPETGISIISPTNRVFVYKYPEKQWHKSFNYNFYSTSLLDESCDEWEIPYLIYEKGIIKTNKPYIFKTMIWYLDKQIGTLFENKITVTDGRFFQECYEEFSKEYIVCMKN